MMNDHDQLADDVIKMLEQKKDECLNSVIIEMRKSDIDLVLEALHWFREGYITYRDELSAYLKKSLTQKETTMDERLEKYLKDNYPEIIPEKFYFECGDGWFLILNAAFREMMKIKSRKRFDNAPYPRVAQIKEKFGTMRFYLDPLDGGEEYYDQIYAVVNMTETLSSRTCESCGRAGFQRGERWIKCHCKWCATDGRPTLNQEWVNGCLEMIEEEKEYKREYQGWIDDSQDALDKLSELDQELGLE